MILEEEKLTFIYGGAKIKMGLISVIAAAVSLIIGIIDGYLRPLKCNK